MRWWTLLLPMFLMASEAPNALIQEDSPYLRQHAYNPVQWLPWGDAAFERAAKEKKPVFLSIGYSTCHWCHVMEEESFENAAIAALINQHTIPVKVDREALPHLDSYYQRLFIKVHGRSGGWPLSVMLTDEQKPFFIGTYIPPDDAYGIEGMRTLLPNLHRKYRDQRHQIDAQSHIMLGMMQAKKSVAPDASIDPASLWDSYGGMYDRLYHGFSRAPKYPEASKITLLLDLGRLGNLPARTMGLKVLREMALRGLYDHVDGGFFRYSVDAAWEIPHFEKMLYNQGELMPLYVRAYRLTGDPLFWEIAQETAAMTQRHFGVDRLFFSASDADWEGEEGGYFTFSVEEMNGTAYATPYGEGLMEAFDVLTFGNFEGKVHLNLYSEARPQGYGNLRKGLQKIRAMRAYPFVDQKIITAWNGMMIEALFSMAAVDARYGVQARRSLDALLKQMYRKGQLYHQTLYPKGPKQFALLEDYAFLVSALLAGYRATYDETLLDLATTLSDQALTHFYDNGVWHQNREGMRVDVDLRDKYYTSSFGRMMQNLLKLGVLKGEYRYAKVVRHSLALVKAEVVEQQGNTPSTAIAWLMQELGVVALKHDQKSLEAYDAALFDVNHPYVMTKAEPSKAFSACDIGSCFATESSFEKMKHAIEGYLALKRGQ